jgi:hypothetical protein
MLAALASKALAARIKSKWRIIGEALMISIGQSL